MATNKQKHVVLLHGLARTKRCMSKLQHMCEQNGYITYNIDYPSTKYDIPTLSDLLTEQLAPLFAQDDITIDFITFSLGGIIVRQILNKNQLKTLGQVIMLAPPNQGSEVCDFWIKYANYIYRWTHGPAGQQLGANNNHYLAALGPASFPLRIIAGNRCNDPLAYFIVDEAHDGKVSVESTKLSGMLSHEIAQTSHTVIMNNKQVIRQVEQWLHQGVNQVT